MSTRRLAGAFGELVLRRAPDGHDEIVSDGTFLMDTRDGRSERGLVTRALDVVVGDRLDVLVAGLGVGFTVGAALASPRVASVTIVEIEPAVVELVRSTTGARTGADLDDPRVSVVLGDLGALLATDALPTVDVLCLDVDNGPGWTLGANGWLYTSPGLDRVRAVVAHGGALTVWSAHDDPRFERLLRERFAAVDAHRWPVDRGEPDVVWVAR